MSSNYLDSICKEMVEEAREAGVSYAMAKDILDNLTVSAVAKAKT